VLCRVLLFCIVLLLRFAVLGCVCLCSVVVCCVCVGVVCCVLCVLSIIFACRVCVECVECVFVCLHLDGYSRTLEDST
jgi:hypothetical protein